jgi:hypothetical protein
MAPSNTSNMARAKTDASSTPNTPSSIELSPLTIFSHATDYLFRISHSPVTNSPRKIEAKTANLPKTNNNLLKLDNPPKKNKEKRRGVADLSKSNKVKDKRKKNKALAWSKKNIPLEDEIVTTPIQNTTPAWDRKKGFTCIVCNKEGFPFNEENRQVHIDGRKHNQIKGLLEAHHDGTTPPTDILRIGPKKWKCHACDCAIQKPHVLTDAVRDHLEWHADRIKSR